MNVTPASTSRSASEAGAMSGVWKAPETATGDAFSAPLAVASLATCRADAGTSRVAARITLT